MWFMNYGDLTISYMNVFPCITYGCQEISRLERGCGWRFENLSLGEDVDGGVWYGFGLSLIYDGWLYVHIGVKMEMETVVGAC